MTRSVQPEPPAVAIVRQNGRSSASRRASSRCYTRVAADLVGPARWSTVGHMRVSTPVKATHHSLTWCRFVGSGLLVRTSRRSLASGDVIKETQSSLTDVVRDVEQAAVRYRTSSLDTKSCQLMCRYIAILDTTAITAIPEMRYAISVSFTNRLSQTLVIAKMCVCSSVYIGPRCDYRLVSAWALAFDCFSFMCHRLS